MTLIFYETTFCNTFKDTVVAIHGYKSYRKYRNAKGGGVTVYIQNHIPVKLQIKSNVFVTYTWLADVNASVTKCLCF